MTNERGFTLAELLVVCAIVGIVMAGLLGLIMSGEQAYLFGVTKVEATQNVRLAMERIVKEIREAGYYPAAAVTAPASCTSPPCYAFNALAAGQTSTSLTLQYDWNGDSVSAASTAVNDPILCATGAPCRGERVTYALAGGDLTRREMGVDSTPQTIASDITNLAFSYFDEDGNTTAITANIRIIGVSITARIAANGASVRMADRVRLRNR